MQKRILVVDDEEAIGKLMARILTKSGYEVQIAASAEEALELIKTYKYMVFFLDLKLPKMNGMELCSIIRKNNPLTICYAITGYASTFEIFDCREAGFEDYFTKPLKLQEIQGAAAQAFLKQACWKRDA